MKTERLYKQSDLQNLIASLPGYVCLKDEDGIYIACNDLQAQHLGFRFAKQLLGKRDFELLGVESKTQSIRNEEIKVMKQGIAIVKEEFCKIGDKKITMLNQKAPFFNSDGIAIGVIHTSVDITEKKELEEQAWILEDIIGKLPVHVWWKNKNLEFLGCNDQQARTVGLKSRYEIKGKRAYDIITKTQSEAERVKQAQKIDRVDKAVIKTGENHIVEEELVLPDGRKVIYLSQKAPLRDSSGNIIGLIGTSMDITNHKDAERLQLENEVYKAEKKSQEKFIKFIDRMQHEMQTYRTEALNEKLGTTKLQITDFDKQISLTKREREVLYYLSLNRSPKEIAKIICGLDEKKKVCDSTINAIINKHLYPKFEVFSIGQLIEKATALKLIPFLPE